MVAAGPARPGARQAVAPALAALLGLLAGRATGLVGVAALAPALTLSVALAGLPWSAPAPSALAWWVAAGATAGAITAVPLPAAAILGAACALTAWWAPWLARRRAGTLLVAASAGAVTAAVHGFQPLGLALASVLLQAVLGAAAGVIAALPTAAPLLGLCALAGGMAGVAGAGVLAGGLVAGVAVASDRGPAETAVGLGLAGGLGGSALGPHAFGALVIRLGMYIAPS